MIKGTCEAMDRRAAAFIRNRMSLGGLVALIMRGQASEIP
jgi:hypothetical protein